MLRFISSLIIVNLFFGACAQQKNKLHLENGVGLNFNIPLVLNSTELSSVGGFGLGYNQLFIPKKNNLVYSTRLDYNLLSYYTESRNQKVKTNNVSISIGAKKHFKSLDSLSVGFHINNGFSVFYGRDQATAGNVGNTSRIGYNDSMKRLYNLGLTVSSELFASKNQSLEFGYTHQLFNNKKEFFVDGVPHTLFLRLNIRFGERDATKRIKDFDVMSKDLTEFAQRNDTLFLLNRSCKEALTDIVLDSMFNRHFKFSPYKVIQTEDIAKLQEQNRVKYFAIVGSHYASKSEPLSIGIYLMDKELNNVNYPYPVFTMYNAMGDKCMNNLEAVAESIGWFNRRLTDKSEK